MLELIDAHVHLLDPVRFHYAWCDGIPALQGSFCAEDYRRSADRAGHVARVSSIVFMEAGLPVAESEREVDHFASLLTNAAEPGVPVAVVIAGAWPEETDFELLAARLAANPRVRGVRRVLHTIDGEAWCRSDRVRANLRALAPLNLTFDVCLRPPLIPAIARLVSECPETLFVLDHCGVPDIRGGAFAPWARDLGDLGRRPNVVCKFSGLAGCCDPGQPLRGQVEPYFDRCLEVFGARRLMWGSDWPLCNIDHDLGAWIEASVALMERLSADERKAVAEGTVRDVYRIEG